MVVPDGLRDSVPRSNDRDVVHRSMDFLASLARAPRTRPLLHPLLLEQRRFHEMADASRLVMFDPGDATGISKRSDVVDAK